MVMTKSLVAFVILVGAVVAAQAPNTDLGYTDTPMLPG